MTGTLRNSLILLVAGVLAITLVWAAADDMFPFSTNLSAWSDGTGTTHAEINATNGNDGSDSTIASTANNTQSEFEFDDVPGDFGSLNSLTIKVAHATEAGGDDNPDFDVEVWLTGPTQSGGTKTSTRQALPVTPGDPFTVEDFTDAAWDALTESGLNDMAVRVVAHTNATGMPDGLFQYITLITVTLDYNVSTGRRRVTLTSE